MDCVIISSAPLNKAHDTLGKSEGSVCPKIIIDTS